MALINAAFARMFGASFNFGHRLGRFDWKAGTGSAKPQYSFDPKLSNGKRRIRN
jgi:hypothetical protein